MSTQESRPPDVHSRLQDLVDEHFGVRPTTPVEGLLTILETELCGTDRLVQRLALAAGVPDEDSFTAIEARVQSLHDAVLGSHRPVTPCEGGPDMCGDCGVDIEDAMGEAVLCPAHGRRDSDVAKEAFDVEHARIEAREHLAQTGTNAGDDVADLLLAACDEVERLRAAAGLVPISSEPMGDSGDYSNDCTGCGRDDLEHEHTWKECHAEVKEQLDNADGHYWEAMGHAGAVTDHHGPPAEIIDQLAAEIRRLGGELPLKTKGRIPQTTGRWRGARCPWCDGHGRKSTLEPTGTARGYVLRCWQCGGEYVERHGSELRRVWPKEPEV